MENNDYLSNKILKEKKSEIYLSMLSTFLCRIQSKLNMGLSLDENYTVSTIENLSFDELKQRLDIIEERINLLVMLQSKNSVNDLLMKIKEDNAVLEKEIDALRDLKNNKKK